MINPHKSTNRASKNGDSHGASLEKEQVARSMISALNLGSMTCSLVQLAQIENALWFCLKTQPKHEHLAATALRRHLGVSCYAPRIRFRKATRRGAVWFVEAMFPGYLFAEFVYSRQHRQVEYSSGIQGVVRFGDQIATVDGNTINRLREKTGEEELLTFNPTIEVGDSVQIAEGPFRGLEA